MAQFEVYTNPMADQRARIRYGLDLQSDHIVQLGSRVIIPLRSLQYWPMPKLHTPPSPPSGMI